LNAGARTVVAIEPAPDNVECLRRNFQKEIAQGRVIVAAKGVWDKEDILPLYEDPNNSAADSFVMPGANAKVTHKIPLTKIDTLVAELNLPRVSVVKMDIKGATLRALEGGRQTLLRDHPKVALSTEEAEDDPGKLSRYLASNYQYRPRCGVCSLAKTILEPEVMLYQ
ncbi:MAG: FkbM family methyltransferase, partial [Acidobacteria bacterium]|nr:FkbM family methyltransferase [Acidobacteriota bacterium]